MANRTISSSISTSKQKKYKSAIDLIYAYAHVPLDEETINVTRFSSGDKLFAFIRGFCGLKGLPNFFTKQMSKFFQPLIEQGYALVIHR